VSRVRSEAEPATAGRLTPGELAALAPLAAHVDCRRVRLHRGGGGRASAGLRALVLFLSRGRAVTLGNQVFLPDRCSGSIPVLAHEVTHCGQYQAWGALRYFARGVADRARELGYRLGIGAHPYHYRLEPGKPFHTYGMEQQGQIVEDLFRRYGSGERLSEILDQVVGMFESHRHPK
jgi:hypothetical protein